MQRGKGSIPPGAPLILIVVDTLRADHLSQYGHDVATSQALDAFFAQATRFTRAYAPSPWTNPSTASLHSGLSPLRHGATRLGRQLQPSVQTLAEALSAAQVKTAAFSHNANISSSAGYAQGFELFTEHRGKVLAYPDISKMTHHAASWLRRNPGVRSFVYLHPMNCHGPYRVPQHAQQTLLGRAPLAGFVYYGRLMRGIVSGSALEGRARVGKAQLQSLHERYNVAVRYAMDEVAGFLQELKAMGVYEQSTIVLTSDHGEELFEHEGFSHGYSLYEEVLRVPLAIKLPEQRVAQTVDEVVTLMDVYPTALELAGLTPPEGLDGRSLLPALRGEALSPRPVLLNTDWPKRAVADALIEGGLKLIHTRQSYDGKHDSFELYDLKADPTEQRDLSASRPEALAHLKQALFEARDTTASRALPPPLDVSTQLNNEALKALGYLE